MVEITHAAGLDPASNIAAHAATRARLIYNQAHSELAGRLWQAALGTKEPDAPGRTMPAGDTSDMAMDNFLALLRTMQDEAKPPVMPQSATPPQPPLEKLAGDEGRHRRDREGRGDEEAQAVAPASPGSLGPNAHYTGVLRDAADRTGIPAGVLGAIVNAEAARDGAGRWLAYSRNPRSSAAGLGQFLSGTWLHEAERPGTWLNQLASSNGWLDAKGHVRRDARSALLERRYDGAASIQAVADYARANLDQLETRGVTIGGDSTQIARAAYLGHHLGLGDAARFLEGGLSEDRAQHLLNAQIGSSAANRRIAAAGGSAAAAHRQWLLHYVDSNLRPLAITDAPALG